MQTRFSNPVSAAVRSNTAPAARPVEAEAEADWLLDIGPVLSLDSLPPPETKRWVIRRKAVVVAAVRAGVISLEEACRRYTLSIEEFLAWQRLVDSHGLPGLRVTRLQDYRSLAAAPAAANPANTATPASRPPARRVP
ncbi:MAG: DUF1153 domain-containing protein [Alphaproteobacteria bacterium]|nr:DUF1153 domain-containing protein [Alphaproteobacteria bacterium]